MVVNVFFAHSDGGWKGERSLVTLLFPGEEKKEKDNIRRLGHLKANMIHIHKYSTKGRGEQIEEKKDLFVLSRAQIQMYIFEYSHKHTYTYRYILNTNMYTNPTGILDVIYYILYTVYITGINPLISVSPPESIK